jgi:DNA-binding NarL/FixJ family response regulator
VLSLTAAPPAQASSNKVRIDVTSQVVRLALSYIAQDHGWTLCSDHSDTCGCVRVIDNHRHRYPGDADIVVVRDTPSDCQDALDTILAGNARAVVLWDEPEGLRQAIAAGCGGLALIPKRVIHLARAAPRLSDRQRRILKLVSAGRSNPEISATLLQSTSTTKRDIAELLSILDAPNRAALTTTANRLGFV